MYRPNDPYFDAPCDSQEGPTDQWYLRQVHAPEAWEILRHTTAKVRVALIDSGVDYNHPDLEGAMARDSQGRIDGYSTVPGCTDLMDHSGHGTICAGILGAQTDNGIGIASIGFNSVEIVPVKAADTGCSTRPEWLAEAISWTMQSGCRVASISQILPDYSQQVQDAINRAWEHGMVLVAAAGNEGSPIPGFPQSFHHVVAIGATDQDDRRVSFSSYGPVVRIGAPGVRMLSTVWSGRGDRLYDAFRGTSEACPLVAGAAAALLASEPELTPQQAVQRLQQTADNVLDTPGDGWNSHVGYGRLNVLRAIRNLPREAATGSFYGQVVDEHGGPVACATVRCGDRSQVTRLNGMFRIPNLAPATHEIHVVSRRGNATMAATIVPGCDTDLTVALGG